MRRKLQIFVSSTFTDLITERQAAVAAILKAGHIPAGMELFTAGDKSQMDTIKRWIDESDVYMLILGGRYGSVEATTGVSYTELEYDYAVEQGKPLFAVVIEEAALEAKVQADGMGFLERENPQLLKQFREKVLSRVSSFFKNEGDIKLCVHESLADFRDSPELKGWVLSSEVEDTRPLHEEIAELRAEILRMQKELKLANAEKNIDVENKDSKINELIQILMETELKIPENIRSDPSGDKVDAFSLFINNQDSLITGVTNAANTSDAESFFYFNLAPKLMRHGLMANEKVPNVQFRRSYVTIEGLAFLEEIARRKVKNRSLPSKSGKPK